MASELTTLGGIGGRQRIIGFPRVTQMLEPYFSLVCPDCSVILNNDAILAQFADKRANVEL